MKQNKPAAISTLFDTYAPALYTVVLQIVRDKEIANTVLETVFRDILNKIKTYDPEQKSLLIWMFKIARNSAIDAIRSENTANALLQYESKSEKIATLEIDNYGLKKLIGKLEYEQRVLLDLCYYKGYTNAEIAEALNIPAETVINRLRMAVLELRAALA